MCDMGDDAVTFQITLGWWLVPTFISVLTVVPAAFALFRSVGTPHQLAEGVLGISLCVIVALVAWLVYFGFMVALS